MSNELRELFEKATCRYFVSVDDPFKLSDDDWKTYENEEVDERFNFFALTDSSKAGQLQLSDEELNDLHVLICYQKIRLENEEDKTERLILTKQIAILTKLKGAAK